MICYDCSRKYGDKYGFPDLILPNRIWNDIISPNKNEGGLLCPSCIIKRLYDANLSDIPACFTSGPIKMVTENQMKEINKEKNTCG